MLVIPFQVIGVEFPVIVFEPEILNVRKLKPNSITIAMNFVILSTPQGFKTKMTLVMEVYVDLNPPWTTEVSL
jgi:hypothetical protein